MQREPLLTTAYFTDNIAFFKGLSDDRRAALAQFPNGDYDWSAVHDRFSKSELKIALNQYSLGTELVEIVPYIQSATEHFIVATNYPGAENPTLGVNFGIYYECLSLLSLNILINSGADVMSRLAESLDLLGRDRLVDRMLARLLPERSITNKIFQPKIFQPLNDIFDADKDVQPEIMKKYLAGWYKNMRIAPWHGSHKEPDATAFFGYWCFEAAGLTQLLDIDDSSYRDQLFYPKDLVRFARAQ